QKCVTDLEAVEGLEADGLDAVLHAQRLLDADELLQGWLLLHDGGLDGEHERTGTAVHDGHFRSADINIGIVDTEAGHGRHQMLDGGDAYITLYQGGREGSVSYIRGFGRDLHHRIEIRTGEVDTGVDRRWTQRQIDFLAIVQPYSGCSDDVL